MADYGLLRISKAMFSRNRNTQDICKSLGAMMLSLSLVVPSVLLLGNARAIAQTKSSARATTKKSKKSKKQRQQPAGTFVLPAATTPTTQSAPPNAAPVNNAIQMPAPTRLKGAVQTSQTSVDPPVQSQPIQPTQGVTVDLRRLGSKPPKGANVSIVKGASEDAKPAPQTIEEVGPPPTSPETQGARAPQDNGGPLIPSPAPSTNYIGEFDEAKGGGPVGTFTIPPDTMGAVGLTKVVSYVNNNIVIHDKATGARLSVASIDALWTSTGATGVFDPRVQYDPYNNRWIISAVSNAQTANSSVLIGLSDTDDPSGTYTVFRLIVGCAPGAPGCNAQGEWADFPMLGFSKNWVAIGWNQFTINTSAFVGGKMLALDYPTLRTGTANGTLFTNASAATGFCMHPATTFSATEDTLYVPTHQQSAGALYRLHRITGTPAAPVFTLDSTARTRPGGGWTQPGGDNAPQTCVGTVGVDCPATIRNIDTGDSFIRSNAVFRNGRIWYAQTIALPTGGLTTNSRFAAQWTALNTDGTFSDGGRVEDATATLINGGQHYAYPSLSVNKNDDVLLGYSNFQSDDFVDAGYSFRLGTDPAATMRDPVIYKEGEDYYAKTFSGTRNRWGDYSHTVVDPSNDLDLWTVQEYAQPRTTPNANSVTNNSRWSTWWAKVAAPAGAGDLLISEFRLRGPNPNGADNEFIEIYNPSTSPHTVTTIDGSAGYSVAASDGTLRFTIPNGTVIPGQGHYLGANSVGYSLAGYAIADATYTTDIPDNAGIALFQTANTANYSTATRIDSVGSTSEANTLYKEGTGYAALTPFSIDYAFYRDTCGKGGSITTFGVCAISTPKDTNNNAADFIFVDTNGTSAGAGQRLGAPGPENLSGPILRNVTIPAVLLDPCVGGASPPNRVRDFTSDPVNNSTFGTLDIRRTFTNNTGGDVTRLRYRVIDLTTFPAPSGIADLRPRTSSSVVVTVDRTPCGSGTSNVTVFGTTLEQPPGQPNGGGFNSSMSSGTITLGTPLSNGSSIDIRWLLGIQQTGSFKIYVNVEALP